MGKGRSAVLRFFLYIFIHTHFVCAVKIEEDKAMVEDLRMAVKVNSEADETSLGFDAHNRKEASNDDVAHEGKEQLDEQAGLDAHNRNEASSDDVAHVIEVQEERDEQSQYPMQQCPYGYVLGYVVAYGRNMCVQAGTVR